MEKGQHGKNSRLVDGVSDAKNFTEFVMGRVIDSVSQLQFLLFVHRNDILDYDE